MGGRNFFRGASNRGKGDDDDKPPPPGGGGAAAPVTQASVVQSTTRNLVASMKPYKPPSSGSGGKG